MVAIAVRAPAVEQLDRVSKQRKRVASKASCGWGKRQGSRLQDVESLNRGERVRVAQATGSAQRFGRDITSAKHAGRRE